MGKRIETLRKRCANALETLARQAVRTGAFATLLPAAGHHKGMP